jgi:parallel beta-helix repeat protein
MRGIILGASSNSAVTNNVVEEASYKTAPGAAICINGYNSEGLADNVLVSGNTVFHSYEGIGLYKKVTNTIVKNNILYDNRKYHIYLDASRKNIIEGNLVYSSKDVNNWGGKQFGITTGNEAERNYCFTGDNEFKGNMLISLKYGFSIGSEIADYIDPNCVQSNNTFTENTIVDSEIANFVFWKSKTGWDGNVVSDNSSWIVNTSGAHSTPFSPVGVNWSNNKFNSNVTGSAANSAILYPYYESIPELAWLYIIPNTANGTTLGTLSFNALINGSTYALENSSTASDVEKLPPAAPKNIEANSTN